MKTGWIWEVLLTYSQAPQVLLSLALQKGELQVKRHIQLLQRLPDTWASDHRRNFSKAWLRIISKENLSPSKYVYSILNKLQISKSKTLRDWFIERSTVEFLYGVMLWLKYDYENSNHTNVRHGIYDRLWHYTKWSTSMDLQFSKCKISQHTNLAGKKIFLSLPTYLFIWKHLNLCPWTLLNTVPYFFHILESFMYLIICDSKKTNTLRGKGKRYLGYPKHP